MSYDKASASIDVLTINKRSPGTYAEGAVVKASTTDGDSFAAPADAGTGLLGIVTNAGGVVSGDRANIQVLGVANCLMAASTTITAGDLVISAGTDGTVNSRVAETTVDVIGIAMATKTSGSSDTCLIPVLLRWMRL